jgi:hypothetical protein
MQADQLLVGVAGQSAARLIDGDEPPIPAHLGNAHGRIVLSGPQPGLALCQSRLPAEQLCRRACQGLADPVDLHQSGRHCGNRFAATEALGQADHSLDRSGNAPAEPSGKEEGEHEQTHPEPEHRPEGATQGGLDDLDRYAHKGRPV